MNYVKSCAILGAVFALGFYVSPPPGQGDMSVGKALLFWGLLTLLGFPIWGVAAAYQARASSRSSRTATRDDKPE
jgi:cyanate permease